MTYPVENVARYILEKTGATGFVRLHKLVYYCQACSLAWDNKALIKDNFQAWPRGPVCSKLYKIHKGKKPVSLDDIPSIKSAEFSEDAINTIEVVLETFGELKGYELASISHLEVPWAEARGNLDPLAKSTRVIPQIKIKEHYKQEYQKRGLEC